MYDTLDFIAIFCVIYDLYYFHKRHSSTLLYLYLYISISRETQDAKGREALIWIVPHHTYVVKVNTRILCEPRFLHLRNQPDPGVEQWIAGVVDRHANHLANEAH